jgi:hypothetical protein
MQKLVPALQAAVFAAVVIIGWPGQSEAAPFMLDNGPGDGSVRVGVDGFGAFGSSIGADSSNAFYNPVGAIGSAGTSYESGIAIGFIDGSGGNPGSRTFLTSGFIGSSGNLPNPTVAGNNLNANSSFTFGSLSFALTETLADSLDNGTRIGSLLDQRYSIANTSTEMVHFDVVRYLDGDLFFDGSIADGGGRIELAGNEVLFETDAASGSEAEATFVGITGIGGVTPATNRFQISSYSGLQSTITSGSALGDFVQNDTDGDQFIDTAYDVTLALRNEFWLAPGESANYQTQTLFGNAVPPAPGSSEAFPLLPPSDEPPFVFEVEQPGGQTIWFDPPVAVGFEYEVASGPLFETVTLPANVQSDPFEILVFDGTDFVSQGFFAPGASFDFTDLNSLGISLFQIQGIDPALGLLPNDPTAFPTGISFTGAGVTNFKMTAITESVSAVPEPSTLVVLLVGLIGLVVLGRHASYKPRLC